MDQPLPPEARPGTDRPAFARWLGTSNEVTRTFLAAGRIPDLVNLGGGLPAPETYPVPELAAFARAAVEDHPAETLGYGPIEGLPALRDAIAARLSEPGLALARENVLITASGLQGLDLLGKVLIDEGSTVAVQDPTYLGALDAWRPRRPAYRSLDLTDTGVDLERLLSGARFAYTVPNFSNPTGRLVELATRERLADAAHATGTWLVEDDPYGGLQYEGAPLPRIVALSGRHAGGAYAGPVIYMGTLSKAIAPGLRIGWVVAAPEMIEALTTAKQGSDLCTSGLSQHVALSALESGLVEAIGPRIVGLYRERRDALCAALEEHLADRLAFERPVGGMFVWAVAGDPALDTDRLLPLALEAGVCFSPGSVFDPTGRNRRALRLNFTLNPPERLREGVRRLASAIQRLSPGAA
jgi:2-aminoadipate transaminase